MPKFRFHGGFAGAKSNIGRSHWVVIWHLMTWGVAIDLKLPRERNRDDPLGQFFQLKLQFLCLIFIFLWAA